MRFNSNISSFSLTNCVALSVNTTLSGPLLSRFDIVLVLLDTKNPEWDATVSSHILAEVNLLLYLILGDSSNLYEMTLTAIISETNQQGDSETGKTDEDLTSVWPLPLLQR